MSSKELVVSQSRHETKVGILEDGQLVEIYFQRVQEYSLAGSIHKGRVTRVLPGMQSAFVDLGLDRDCFLYVSDFFEEHADEIDRVDERAVRGRDRERERSRGRGRERSPEAEPRPEREAALPVEVSAEEPVLAEAATDEDEGAGTPQGGAGEVSREKRRRSRRRRRGGRGFPESKYASGGEGEEGAVPGAEPGGEPLAVESASEEEPEAAEAAVAEELTLLPGESLAKYRSAGAAALGEETSSDAAPEEESEDVMEQILDRVEELDGDVREDASAAGEAEAELLEEETAEEAAGEGEATAIEEAGAEEEAVPAEASEEPAVTEAEPAEASADEGVEPARMPQSLTATLRAQGGRLAHHVSRRSRRRGRNNPSAAEGAPAEETAGASAAAEVAELQAPAPRERDRDWERKEKEKEKDRDKDKGVAPSISDLLKEGQEIIVQIAKEPLGQKGARITSHIALPGRYVVYMPTIDHLGVSRKISTEEERQRLKRALQRQRAGLPGGFIMRTAGEGKSEEDIGNDMRYLANLWQDIKNRAEKRRAPSLLHHDVAVVERILRDHLTEGFKAIWVDHEEMYEQVLHSVERFAPALLGRVKLYTRTEPIFDAFGITQELEKALRPKVWLKSGGYIVINQTEALVAIDVNTGKYVGKSNRLEDTIVKTNLEAVREIVRQVRLRDLGGIIVVDFIDMDERKNRQKVMQSLEETMRADKAPYKILQFNDFGLVAITRKRVKQSLERTLCAPCPYCEGSGYVKSVQTVIGEILNQAHKYAKVVEGQECVLRVNPDVAKMLKSVETKYLEELEEVLGRPVMVISDGQIHQEKFDLT